MNAATSPPADARAAALRELARGHQPIPIAARTKGPNGAAWGKQRYTPADVPGAFAIGSNIGLLVGAASGNLVDVDLDSPEAVALADKFLPPTGMEHGHASRPRSHRWYRTDRAVDYEKFNGPDGKTLVELRSSDGSTQAQTVIPPSIHPDGDAYAWDKNGDPAPVNADDLVRAVRRLVAATLIARTFASLTKGNRHLFALALGGVLLRGGMDKHDGHALMLEAFTVGGSSDPRTRADTIYATAAKLEAGEAVTGVPGLKRALGSAATLHGAFTADKFITSLTTTLNLTTATAPIERGARFNVTDGQICRLDVPLCNFEARIVEEVTYDDGADKRKVFAIEGSLSDGTVLPRIEVESGEFEGMSWPLAQWGARAIVYSARDCRQGAREGIQRLSNPKARTVRTNTGWCETGGSAPVFLHAGGAIGADDVTVETSQLGLYKLPDVVDNIVDAVRTSHSLLEVGPIDVTALLLACAYTAPLADPLGGLDFAPWIHGTTGSCKSTLAALVQQHYGAGFDRLHLPGNFSSTANALEAQLHRAKDVACVVDDVSPPRTLREEAAQKEKLERVLRSIGNGASRARLSADLKERAPRPPRGLVLVTAEMAPPPGSLGARTVPVELKRADLDLGRLSALQSKAHRLPHAMRGYVEFLRRNLPALRHELPLLVAEQRDVFNVHGQHLRQPQALATLHVGLQLFGLFAREVGALTDAEVDAMMTSATKAFLRLGIEQTQAAKRTAPEQVVFETLEAMIMQGTATLAPKGTPLTSASGSGRAIGWTDGTRAYLLARPAFDEVAEHLRRVGAAPLGPHAELKRSLVDAGYVVAAANGDPEQSAKVDGTTVPKRVLVFSTNLGHARPIFTGPAAPAPVNVAAPIAAVMKGGN